MNCWFPACQSVDGDNGGDWVTIRWDKRNVYWQACDKLWGMSNDFIT